MKVLQIAAIEGHGCGIGLFAEKLRAHMRGAGVEIETATGLPRDVRADVVLLHHHEELFSSDQVVSLAAACPVPAVLFAHAGGTDRLTALFDGCVAMCPGTIGSTDTPTHVFPHPAWIPRRLEERNALRREFGLPERRTIAGTNGFLKFERQFVEVAEALLPEARRNDWFLELLVSPWRVESPGLLPRLNDLHTRDADHFRFQHAFLDAETLNRRLQACDLLWCWTAAPSSAYASGVISDQYASGTRVIAADKQQHSHVLTLPNAVAAPDTLGAFVESLVDELRSGPRQRHDPTPVSWEHCVHDLAAFLRDVAA